eukprot:1155938-Pelagomonas_calceolata.AAC.2
MSVQVSAQACRHVGVLFEAAASSAVLCSACHVCACITTCCQIRGFLPHLHTKKEGQQAQHRARSLPPRTPPWLAHPPWTCAQYSGTCGGRKDPERGWQGRRKWPCLLDLTRTSRDTGTPCAREASGASVSDCVHGAPGAASVLWARGAGPFAGSKLRGGQSRRPGERLQEGHTDRNKRTCSCWYYGDVGRRFLGTGTEGELNG